MTEIDISRALGRLEAQVSEISDRQKTDSDEAKEHRKTVNDTICTMGRDIGEVRRDIADMKPVVDQIRQARMFIIAVLFVGAALISTLTLGRDKLAAIARWLAG